MSTLKSQQGGIARKGKSLPPRIKLRDVPGADTFVVTRTRKGTRLSPRKAGGSTSKLFVGKLEVHYTHKSEPSDPMRMLVDSVVLATMEKLSGIPQEELPEIVERINSAEDPRSLIFDELLVDSYETRNERALERAIRRGERSKAELLRQPGMLTGEQLADRISTARATVDNRRVQGKLLAIDFGSKRGFRYPDWQAPLVMDPDLRGNFEAVLGELADINAWTRYRFFMQVNPALAGRTPLAALQQGERAPVVAAARVWAEGDHGGS